MGPATILPVGVQTLTPQASGLPPHGALAASFASFVSGRRSGRGFTSMSAKSYASVIGANDRIRIGFIGVGGMGGGHVGACKDLKDQDNLEFLGVADCWTDAGRQTAADSSGTKAFQDYRKLLDIKEIDYVTIATPEHWHSHMTIDALDAGKAVYCEKPMTHSIPQAQAVMKKQKATGLPVQVGVQAMSDDSYSSAAKAIADGVMGQVVQAQIEYVRRYDKQGPWRDPDLDRRRAQAGRSGLECLARQGRQGAPGIRTTITSGAATRPIPAASAPTCSFTASRGS